MAELTKQELDDLYDSLDGEQPWRCKTCGQTGVVDTLYGCFDLVQLLQLHDLPEHEIVIGELPNDPFRFRMPGDTAEGQYSRGQTLKKPVHTPIYPTDLDERLALRAMRDFPND